MDPSPGGPAGCSTAPAPAAAPTKPVRRSRRPKRTQDAPRPAEASESLPVVPAEPQRRKPAGVVQSTYGVSLPATAMDVRLLAKDKAKKKDEIYIPGPIFPDPAPDRTDYPLYFMLKTMSVDGREPVPGIPLIEASDYEAFELLVGKIHGLFVRYLGRSKKVILDDVVHRVAFAFSKRITPFETPEIMFGFAAKERKDSGSKTPIWTPVLDYVLADFEEAGYGWRGALFPGAAYWKAEAVVAGSGGFEPRTRLFPSYHATKAGAEAEAATDAEIRRTIERLEDGKREQSAAIRRTFELLSPERSEELWSNTVFVGIFKSQGNITGNLPGEPFLSRYRERYGGFPEAFRELVAAIGRGEHFLNPPEGLAVLRSALANELQHAK